MEKIDDLDYTQAAWESLYDVIDDSKFVSNDAKMIYLSLVNKIKLISFGDYLKRYIYLKTELEQPFSEVGISDYQMIIKEAFAENATPPSFNHTTAKIGALSKNWLTQQSVKRNVVFLLGFGLHMSTEDVNTFLTKALCEPMINPKNPFEVICWYCYQHGYNYKKYENLWEMYNSDACSVFNIENIMSNHTIVLQNSLSSLKDDMTLMSYLQRLKTADNNSLMSKTSRHCFDKLYDESRELIANIYNADIDNKKEYTKDDITESDFEHIICAAIPVNRHGNLTPIKASKLNDQFLGKRFSRQHIGEILSGNAEVNRFDLITLNFFIFSQKLEEYSNVNKRYNEFLESTNRILSHCFMDKMYIQNPYECFVLMCILSEEPLSTYADVWELSYSKTSPSDMQF